MSSELVVGVVWDRMCIDDDVIELRPIGRRGLVLHRGEVEAVEFERQWLPPVWVRTVIRFRFGDGVYARKVFVGRTRAVRGTLIEAGWPVRQVPFGSTEPRAVREPRRDGERALMDRPELPDEVALDRAVQALLMAIDEELGPTATSSRVDEDTPRWLLQPTDPDAVPITVGLDGRDPVYVHVVLGQLARMELGWERDATLASVLTELEEICRAVVAGRVRFVKKRGSNAVRYWLTQSDGTVREGSMSWLFPAMPWTELERIEPAPYA